MWGDKALMEGGQSGDGGSPSPPTRETLNLFQHYDEALCMRKLSDTVLGQSFLQFGIRVNL